MRIYHSAVVDEYRARDRLLRQRYGHELEVVCPPRWSEGGSAIEPSDDPDVPVNVVAVHGRAHPSLFWYDVAGLRRVLRRLRPEIVDLHEEPFSLAAGAAQWAIAREVPRARLCIYSAQNLPKRYPPPFSLIERHTLRRASAAYPCSTEAGERLRARGFDGDLQVLPLGVTVPPRRAVSPAAAPRVGFVGRLEPYKGGRLAVEAFIAATRDLDARMEIVGDGSELEPVRRQAALAGAGERIRFTGSLAQDETLRRIGQMDVVLIPSLSTPTWKEQFGRVAAQAMAAGVAVIASDSGSLRELVAGAGMLVPEGDLAALTGALRRLLTDRPLLADLAARGRQRALERFSWDVVAERMDAIYRAMR